VTTVPFSYFFILSSFQRVRDHTICAEGFEYETGKFRNDRYRAFIRLISGIDLVEMVTPAQCFEIYCRISDVIADVKTRHWLAHYCRQYPYNRRNFPIDIRNHIAVCNGRIEEEPVEPVMCPSCELEFLQTLFKMYYDYKLYLFPVTSSVTSSEKSDET
jgi:hypothetical protein